MKIDWMGMLTIAVVSLVVIVVVFRVAVVRKFVAGM